MPIKSLPVAGESLFSTFDNGTQKTPYDSVWSSVALPRHILTKHAAKNMTDC